MSDVFLYVTHLFGIGHLRRAAAIARALAERGVSVALVSGGFPVPGLDTGRAKVVQLPPVRSRDETFRVLLNEQDAPIDDAWRRRRCGLLLGAFAEARPAVLLTESFPFGRRALRFELLPLLDAAAALRPRPRILSSVRDLLVRKPPEKTAWMADLAAGRYDAVLVHGDPALLPFDVSFPWTPRIADRLHYTGYIRETDGPVGPWRGGGEVLVSAGGGAFGRFLLQTALAARPLTRYRAAPWRLLAGPNLPAEDFADLTADLPEGVVLERHRPDFPRLLSHAALSISLGGYNTVVALLAAGTPAVVVGYAAGQETEQAERASLLEQRGWLTAVGQGSLTPAALASAIEREAGRPRPVVAGLSFDGLSRSVDYIAAQVAIVRTEGRS